MEVCSELIQRRKKIGIKQAEIANKIGISPPNISCLEKGTGTIGLGKLTRTAEAYGGDKRLALRLLQFTHPGIWRIILELREEIICELTNGQR